MGRDIIRPMPEDWALLASLGTEQEAMLMAGFLENQGVPARVESRLFRQEPVTLGQLGAARLLVPAERLEEARRLIERRTRFALLEGRGEREADEREAAGEDVEEVL